MATLTQISGLTQIMQTIYENEAFGSRFSQKLVSRLFEVKNCEKDKILVNISPQAKEEAQRILIHLN